MLDFRGNSYGPGDTVIYAAGSGRSITMIEAEVVSINEGEKTTVTLAPKNSSRWEQHGQDVCTDTRTGKRANPYEHVKEKSHWRHKKTGELITHEAFTKLEREVNFLARTWINIRPDYDYVPYTFQDYIKKERVVKNVTIKVTDNIVVLPKDN